MSNQEVEHNENFYYQVINCLDEYAIFTINKDHNINSWNNGAERLLGYKDSEILGKNFSLLYTKEDNKNGIHEVEIQNAKNKGKALDERWHVKKNGEKFWASGLLFPLKNKNKELIGYTKILRDLTHKKNLEDQLKISIKEAKEAQHTIENEKERLDIAQKAGKIGTFEWLIKENKIYWTKELQALYGLNENGFGGKYENWIQRVHPDDRIIAEESIKNAMKGESKYNVEFKILLPNNKIRWVIAMGEVFFDKDNKAERMIGINMDITQRKVYENNIQFLSEASNALNSSLDYQDTLNKLAKLAVPFMADWCSVEMINDKGEIKQVSVAHKDSKKIEWAKKIRERYLPDMSTKTGLSKVLRTKKSELYSEVTIKSIFKASVEDEEVKNLGDLGITSAMIVPIIINNKALGVIQFISSESGRHYDKTDLSIAEEVANRASLSIINAELYEAARKEIRQRKKTQKELKKSQMQFQALYNSNIIGVVYADLNGRIKDANDAYLRILGFNREEITKKDMVWKKITPLEYEKADRHAAKELITKGFSTPYEKEYIKKDGSQVPVIIGNVLLNKKTTDTVSFVLDMTERKKLEQRKDEFIGIASHELKTPLTSIKGYVQILEKIIQQMGDEKLKLYLHKTNTYIERLNSLISDLLDVSKIQAGKLLLNFSVFDFDEFVDEAIENIQNTNKSHKIIRIGSINKFIKADKHRVEQVLINLLTNAIKYSPKATKVVVEVKMDKNNVLVSVQDFGIGIAKKAQEKLFQRFYRVEASSKKFSGLGIGLYISYQIIQRHHGKIGLHSQEEKGSTFYFSLPIKNSTLLPN